MTKNKLGHWKSMRLHKLANKIGSCDLCEELARNRTTIVNGYGDFQATALYIGEAPGVLGANITGVPFTRDRSGVLLQKMLHKIGMNKTDPRCERPVLKDAYITNIVRCNPRNKDKTNRTPTRREIQLRRLSGKRN